MFVFDSILINKYFLHLLQVFTGYIRLFWPFQLNYWDLDIW